MHQEKYSLTWHTYSDHLKNMMKELMMNEDFSDVTLITEDKKKIKANICILSACSPVFEDILKKEKNSSQIMYLRGVQFSEMESIMQFIYLGEATFYSERIDEFLSVAKSLEIKELCNAETETNDELENESHSSDLVPPSNEKIKEQTHNIDQQAQQVNRDCVVAVNDKYDCKQCQTTYCDRSSLRRHKKAIHVGIKYACGKCDYNASQQSHLTRHIQSIHDGVKYACDQCDYNATQQYDLTKHILSKHEDVKYACDQCEFQTTRKDSLGRHIKNKHNG